MRVNLLRLFKYVKYFSRTLYINLKLKSYPHIDSPFFSLIAASRVELFSASTARIDAMAGCHLRLGYDRCGTSSFEESGIGLELHDRAVLKIVGNSSVGHGASIRIYPDGVVKIGNNTYIAGNANIGCASEISIGNDCAISWNVTIIDSDFHSWSLEGIKKEMTMPIIIENHVWIGNNAIILKGVTIGEGSIVGAGSVVTRSIPPHSLAAGNPARIISSSVEW